MTTKIKPASRSQEIYEELRVAILDNGYHAGQKLSENNLARRYGLSRTPIREILKRLEQERLIIIRPKSGTYVLGRSASQYVEAIEVRAYLERLAFRRAVARITDEELDELRETVRKAGRLLDTLPLDTAGFADLHHLFHRRLVEFSGNETLLRHFESLILVVQDVFALASADDVNLADLRYAHFEHARILGALQQRNPVGERLIFRHLWRMVEALTK